jgi:transglutaminase-like putative cysteine protease
MRISVVHSTVYRYDRPVRLEPHIFRLRPREEPAQRLAGYAIEIEPRPAGTSASLDLDGNAAIEAWFDGPTERLSVRTSFEVETLRDNPFDFLLTSDSYDAPLRTALAPYLAGGDCSEVRGILPDAAHPLDFLSMLTARLFRDFRHVTRHAGPPLAPEVTLREGSGSCRDLAVVFCSACRARGLAARFVSGYEQAAALHDGQMHAWAEVYLPGGGWRGYDPSRGLAVAQGHVALAAAADPKLAAPIAGAYRGAAQSRMEFAISMQTEGR